jgi:hypothetical protein
VEGARALGRTATVIFEPPEDARPSAGHALGQVEVGVDDVLAALVASLQPDEGAGPLDIPDVTLPPGELFILGPLASQVTGARY